MFFYFGTEDQSPHIVKMILKSADDHDDTSAEDTVYFCELVLKIVKFKLFIFAVF